jgi:hypothetical protein
MLAGMAHEATMLGGEQNCVVDGSEDAKIKRALLTEGSKETPSGRMTKRRIIAQVP